MREELVRIAIENYIHQQERLKINHKTDNLASINYAKGYLMGVLTAHELDIEELEDSYIVHTRIRKKRILKVAKEF